MAQSGVIIRRNSGSLIPNAYAGEAVKANPTAWGVAIVKEGELLLNKGTEIDLEIFQSTIEDFKDSDITFHLVNSPGAVNLDDVSPHTILSNNDKDKTPLLVAFIDGKFPQYEKAGSSHPGEFFVANEYLIPKLQEMFDMTGGDIAKVMEALKRPHFKNEMLLSVTPHGVITFVAATGDSLSFYKADNSAEYGWGWVSQNYGYALAPPTTKKEEPKKTNMFSKSTVREKAPTQGNPVIAAATAAPTTATADVKSKIEVFTWKPDRMSRSQKKDAIKQRIGYLPKGFTEDNFTVQCYRYADTKKLITFAEYKKMGLAAVGLPALNNPPAQNDRDNKDVQPDNIPQPDVTEPSDKKVTSEVLPLMSPTTREHIKKIMSDTSVQKLISDNADIMSDPKKTQALEAKFADFSTQLGQKKIDDYMPWSYEMMLNLGKEKPDGLAVMCWTFRNMLAGKMAKETKAEPVSVPEPKRNLFSKKVA